MRLDKYLKVSRIIRRRPVCKGGSQIKRADQSQWSNAKVQQI